MDTPLFDIEWMLRIDDAINTEENRRNGSGSQPAPAPPTPRIS